MGATEPIDIE